LNQPSFEKMLLHPTKKKTREFATRDLGCDLKVMLGF
jgi:hypothetical protein